MFTFKTHSFVFQSPIHKIWRANSHHPLAFYLLRFISATISLENSNYFYSSLYYIGRSHLSTLIVYSIGDKQYAYSNFSVALIESICVRSIA